MEYGISIFLRPAPWGNSFRNARIAFIQATESITEDLGTIYKNTDSFSVCPFGMACKSFSDLYDGIQYLRNITGTH